MPKKRGIHYEDLEMGDFDRKIIEMGDVFAMLEYQRVYWLVALGIQRVDSGDIPFKIHCVWNEVYPYEYPYYPSVIKHS